MSFVFDRGEVRKLEIMLSEEMASVTSDVVFSSKNGNLQTVSQHTVHVMLNERESKKLAALAEGVRQLHKATLNYLGDYLREGNRSDDDGGDNGTDAPDGPEGLGGHPFIR